MRTNLGLTVILLMLGGPGPARAEVGDDYRPVAEAVTAALVACLAASDGPESDRACAAEAHRSCLGTGPRGDSTYGRVVCADIERKAWTDELVRAMAQAEDRLRAVSERAHRALLDEQEAWSAFRAARCTRALEAEGGDPDSPVDVECATAMLAERVIEMRGLGLPGTAVLED
jgi:uncharacterized protein YecT (DUF1311 family)